MALIEPGADVRNLEGLDVDLIEVDVRDGELSSRFATVRGSSFILRRCTDSGHRNQRTSTRSMSEEC